MATVVVRFTERRLYDKRQKLDILTARLGRLMQLAKMTRRFDTASEKLTPLVRYQNVHQCVLIAP